MSFIKKALSMFRFQYARDVGPRALASSLPGWTPLGEPKDLDQRKLLELAESDPDVRACIDAIVDAVSTNGWVVEAEQEDIKEKIQLYLRGWGEDKFWEFIRNLTGLLVIFDEAYIEVVDPPRLIAPWTMQVKRDNYGNVTGYVQQTTYRVEFQPEEIVHIILHPIADRAYGSPKLATLRRIIEAKREAELFYYNVFLRKGVLSKAIIMKAGTELDYQRLVNELQTTRPGDDLLIMGDIQVVDLGNPVKELEILEMLRDFRQKILAVFRVPPIVYGLEGGVNLETSRNQMVNFQQHIRSMQRIISAGITEALHRLLGLRGFSVRLLEWTNPEQMVRMHSILVQSGLETINEARKILGLQELEHSIANIPLPLLQLGAKTGYFAWDIQESLSQLLAQSARAVPEKAITYPRWLVTLDEIVLQYVDPESVDLTTIRHLTIDSERGIVLSVADVAGDEYGLMRRPVALRFSRRYWTLESAQRWYDVVFPSYIMKALETGETG
ncbi:MAG: phage portal protein [Thermofilaceae archaeon]